MSQLPFSSYLCCCHTHPSPLPSTPATQVFLPFGSALAAPQEILPKPGSGHGGGGVPRVEGPSKPPLRSGHVVLDPSGEGSATRPTGQGLPAARGSPPLPCFYKQSFIGTQLHWVVTLHCRRAEWSFSPQTTIPALLALHRESLPLLPELCPSLW